MLKFTVRLSSVLLHTEAIVCLITVSQPRKGLFKDVNIVLVFLQCVGAHVLHSCGTAELKHCFSSGLRRAQVGERASSPRTCPRCRKGTAWPALLQHRFSEEFGSEGRPCALLKSCLGAAVLPNERRCLQCMPAPEPGPPWIPSVRAEVDTPAAPSCFFLI